MTQTLGDIWELRPNAHAINKGIHGFRAIDKIEEGRQIRQYRNDRLGSIL